MSKGIKLHVWGDYALFTRPEMKVERVSYEVMTPSAARNILTAIYWKPQIRWVVDRIRVLKPIAFSSVRRNEVASKAVTPSAAVMRGEEETVLGLCPEDDRQQRASLVLRNVGYVIEAHFDVVERTLEAGGPEMPEETCAAKHISIFNRRAASGQAFHQPYLGCRECTAHYRLREGGEIETIPETRDLGLMLYDMDYSDLNRITPMFFRAQMVNGVIDVADCEVVR